uniref:Uncharacterized protein n=1 Tax=Anopheles albimanus TaxID=7167 RepID=A0A182FG36_ANOAL
MQSEFPWHGSYIPLTHGEDFRIFGQRLLGVWQVVRAIQDVVQSSSDHPPVQYRAIKRAMSLCANIKFHGYLIVVFSTLLTTTILVSSAILKLVYHSNQDTGSIPEDSVQDLIDYGWLDFAGDIVQLFSIGVLFYGIRKENRFCLLPFLLSIVFDWVAYVVAHTRNSSTLPYQVWLVTTVLFFYVFVTLIGLYKLFQIKAKTGSVNGTEEEFSKTFCL